MTMANLSISWFAAVWTQLPRARGAGWFAKSLTFVAFRVHGSYCFVPTSRRYGTVEEDIPMRGC